MFRAQFLTGRGISHPRFNKGGKALFIQLLQLTAAALAEMTTYWGNVVRSWLQGAIGQQQIPGCRAPSKAARCGYPITFCGDAQDLFGL